MDKEILKQAGLSAQEIEVYLALVKFGSIPVSKISSLSGLHRSNLYDTLEKLQLKGLTAHVIKNGVKYYQATPPSRLISYFEERLENIRNIIPELEGLSKLPKEGSSVELYTGKEGIKSIFKHIIELGSDYCVCGAAERFEELFPVYSKQFLRQVNEKGIKERILFQQGTKVEVKTKKGEYRFLPTDYIVPSSFNVYGSNVAIFVWTMPMFAILIKSPDVAETYTKYFEFLWNVSKE